MRPENSGLVRGKLATPVWHLYLAGRGGPVEQLGRMAAA
jgi:hypothetical protein